LGGTWFNGWFHADEGHIGESLAEVIQGGGGGGVAGHNNQGGSPGRQKTGDLFAEEAYLVRRAGTIRNMGLIRKIE
jgi:hypothetical protein